MRAVSDTSPISTLASIGLLSLLELQFSEIWIPPAVLGELRLHPDPVAMSSIQTAISKNWIRSRQPPSSHLLSVLSLHLDIGEAEAIGLAIDMKADVVLIDEQEGRQFAAHAGLTVTGVLGILLRAKLMGDVPALKPAIQLLHSKAHFFISAALEAKILAAAGE